jgi:hypothetical protein
MAARHHHVWCRPGATTPDPGTAARRAKPLRVATPAQRCALRADHHAGFEGLHRPLHRPARRTVLGDAGAAGTPGLAHLG